VRSSLAHRFRIAAVVDLTRRDVVTGTLLHHRLNAFPLPKDANGLADFVSLRISGKVESLQGQTQLRLRVLASPVVLLLIPFLALLTLTSVVVFLLTGDAIFGLAAGIGVLVVITLLLVGTAINDWERELEVTESWVKSLKEQTVFDHP
jgi:hypothetical protein